MARREGKPERAALHELAARLDGLRGLFPTLSRDAAKKTRAELERLLESVRSAAGDLDPIKDPRISFDPSNPSTTGRLVVLALLAQDRVPLERIGKTYGSGIYAIYYDGKHPLYAPVVGTETPVYVGKADPKAVDAASPREQGPQLWGRLHDHRKAIRTVEHYAIDNDMKPRLSVGEFTCRRLVCATNAQLVAEKHLIGLFRPIWNNETKRCWGISKHGDSAKTRSNKRSPWDVIHPGRKWANEEKLVNAMAPDVIAAGMAEHFAQHPPFADRDAIIQGFLAAFKQDAGLVSSEASARDDEDEDDGPLE